MRSQGPRSVQRGRDVSGQALVEFTMVLPLLLMLFFGIIEFGLYFYTRVSLRHVVRESARFAITGNTLTDSTGTPMSRAKSIESKILSGAPAIHLTPANITMTPADGGGPGQVVQINVNYDYTAKLPPFSLLFPNGRLRIKVGTVTKNENY
jgi:Flp pilus assembly protein TadG